MIFSNLYLKYQIFLEYILLSQTYYIHVYLLIKCISLLALSFPCEWYDLILFSAIVLKLYYVLNAEKLLIFKYFLLFYFLAFFRFFLFVCFATSAFDQESFIPMRTFEQIVSWRHLSLCHKNIIFPSILKKKEENIKL